jgi:hypothetical protein
MEEKKTNNNKLMIISAIIILAVGAGSFYGGMRYAQSKATTQQSAQAGGRFQGLRGAKSAGGNRAAGGFISGEIIKQDDKSVTLKLLDGGSKIIYYTDTTKVSKTASGTKADLIIGKNISVVGSANSDGSIVAETIQLRPAQENQPQPLRQ